MLTSVLGSGVAVDNVLSTDLTGPDDQEALLDIQDKNLKDFKASGLSLDHPI